MQYHYVIVFDDVTKKWSVENELGFLPDGNIWNQSPDDDDDYGWIIPEDGSLPDLIDQRCHNMLNALVPIWPEVDTTPYP